MQTKELLISIERVGWQRSLGQKQLPPRCSHPILPSQALRALKLPLGWPLFVDFIVCHMILKVR